MKLAVLIPIAIIVAAYFNAPGIAQNPSCPSGAPGSCNCQLNNVEALRTLIRSEVETEVANRLAATPGMTRTNHHDTIIVNKRSYILLVSCLYQNS